VHTGLFVRRVAIIPVRAVEAITQRSATRPRGPSAHPDRVWAAATASNAPARAAQTKPPALPNSSARPSEPQEAAPAAWPGAAHDLRARARARGVATVLHLPATDDEPDRRVFLCPIPQSGRRDRPVSVRRRAATALAIGFTLIAILTAILITADAPLWVALLVGAAFVVLLELLISR
jgi:hypothetical protein